MWLHPRLSVVLFAVVAGQMAVYGQHHDYSDTIVHRNQSVVVGSVKKVNFYRARKIFVNTENGLIPIKRKDIQRIQVQGETYTKKPIQGSDKHQTRGRLVRSMVADGEVQVYRNEKRFLFTKENEMFLANQLRFYVDDAPNFKALTTKPGFNADSLVRFIAAYNEFKRIAPESKSFSQLNKHAKPFFNPNLGLNFTGIIPFYSYIGAELGLSNTLTLSPRFSSVLNNIREDRLVLRIAPYAELALKYYWLDGFRKANRQTTFRYSGFYVSTTLMNPLQAEFAKALRYELGVKGVSYDRFFVEYNAGVINNIETGKTALWLTWGLGFILK